MQYVVKLRKHFQFIIITFCLALCVFICANTSGCKSESPHHISQKKTQADILRVDYEERMKDPEFRKIARLSPEQLKRSRAQLIRKRRLLEIQMQDPFSGITRQHVMRGIVKLFNETHGTEYISLQQLMSDFSADRLTGEQEGDVLRWNRQGNAMIDDDLGACCFADGDCVDSTTFQACTSVGGSYEGNFTTCAGLNCLQPIGACCGTDWCRNLVEVDCIDIEGDWLGNNTNCADFICP